LTETAAVVMVRYVCDVCGHEKIEEHPAPHSPKQSGGLCEQRTPRGTRCLGLSWLREAVLVEKGDR
jgi:rubredoxin